MKYQKLIDNYRDKKSLPRFHPERRSIEDQLFNAFVNEMNVILKYNNRTKVRRSLTPMLSIDTYSEPEYLKGLEIEKM